MTDEVFVHIDAISGRIGNGGFVMLTQLAHELSRMGFMVNVFDHLNRLPKANWEWLSDTETNFGIAQFESVLEEKDTKIWSGWLDVLLDDNCELIGGIDSRRICYWSGELMRNNLHKAREFINKHLKRIAITNATLQPYYERVFDGEIIPLDNWIRRDLFSPEYRDEIVAWPRLSGTVAYQSDNFVFSIKEDLEALGMKIGLAEGTQSQVACRMLGADYYIQWNRFSDAISMFEGETFGLSLFEAMACGCVPIARWHQGIDFLRGYIPMVWEIESIPKYIQVLEDDPGMKEQIRRHSRAIIETGFRFDQRRQDAITRMMEQ